MTTLSQDDFKRLAKLVIDAMRPIRDDLSAQIQHEIAQRVNMAVSDALEKDAGRLVREAIERHLEVIVRFKPTIITNPVPPVAPFGFPDGVLQPLARRNEADAQQSTTIPEPPAPPTPLETLATAAAAFLEPFQFEHVDLAVLQCPHCHYRHSLKQHHGLRANPSHVFHLYKCPVNAALRILAFTKQPVPSPFSRDHNVTGPRS